MRVYAGVNQEKQIILLQFRPNGKFFDPREWQYRLPNASQEWKQFGKKYALLDVGDPPLTTDPNEYLGFTLKVFPHKRLRISRHRYTNVTSDMVEEIRIKR